MPRTALAIALLDAQQAIQCPTDAAAPITGLRAFAPEDRPPVNAVFQSYHLMVAIGMGLIGLSLIAALGIRRRSLLEKRWLLWAHVFAVVGPYIANQAGWVSAEVGRQPFIVYGHLRTSDGLSEAVVAEHVLVSIIMFGLIYAMLFVVWVWVLNHKIQHGPEPAVAHAGGAPISGGKDLLIATANLSQPGKGHSLSGTRDEEEDNAQTEEEEGDDDGIRDLTDLLVCHRRLLPGGVLQKFRKLRPSVDDLLFDFIVPSLVQHALACKVDDTIDRLIKLAKIVD